MHDDQKHRWPSLRRDAWLLAQDVTYLNHGSFGACPAEILAAQQAIQARIERQPLDFFTHDLQVLQDAVRLRVAAELGADPAGLAFVTNATEAVNAVAWSLVLAPGDELLTTDHTYNACSNALVRAAQANGARIVVADVPVPCASESEVIAAVLAKVTDRTVFGLLDHITSPTAMMLPVAGLVSQLRARGVAVMVDGAHALGQLDLSLHDVDADWYTGNCHKWLCTPKGSAILHTRADRIDQTMPAVTSHGFNRRSPGRTRYQAMFDWPGTHDPSASLVAPAAIDFLSGLLPGGMDALRERNNLLCGAAVALLGRRLGLRPIAPASMRAAMAALLLPEDITPVAQPCALVHPLQASLRRQHKIEVPIVPCPGRPGRWLLRISAQAYNSLDDYERLADALAEHLP